MFDAKFKLGPEAVGIFDAADKSAALAELAKRFSLIYQLGYTEVLDALEEREALGSTGFGRGIAIPHARVDGITEPVSVVMRLNQPIAFKAADGMPVDLIFGLLSPVDSGVGHLHALAEISRLLRDETVRNALSIAADGEELFAIIANVRNLDAA